jgi:hypothetical protein
MSYIEQKRRDEIENSGNVRQAPKNIKDLWYVVSMFSIAYLQVHDANSQSFGDIFGSLERAKNLATEVFNDNIPMDEPSLDDQTEKFLLSSTGIVGARDIEELFFLLNDIFTCYIGIDPRVRSQKYNEVMGVIEMTKLELYRRFVASNEDKNMAQNGDFLEV